MAVIGSATLNIVPKVEGGLSNYINGEIAKANVAGSGERAGSSFMGGFASGASIGIWSQIASRAIGAVTDSLGAAASRVDTLNNYPRIMNSLGVETEVANRSISTMSDALQNVPTRLDDMATTVQGLYAATQRYGISLDTVTDAGLALNSMLLAGGQSQTIVNSAMEQFRQMVSKGKPELQDWKSLIQAAPGQLNQLAKEMLGTAATADDLYAALGGGKAGDYDGPFEWGSLGMDEFITRFANMREQFESSAQDAQGGIQTAFSNMQNAVTRGVAGVLDAFGQDNIAGALNDVKGVINDVFSIVQDVAVAAAPTIMAAWDGVMQVADVAVGSVASVIDMFKYGMEGAATGQNRINALNDAIQTVSGSASGANGTFDILGRTIESSMERARASYERARTTHEEYLDTVASAADTISAANNARDGEVARLEYAASVIEAYSGKTELSAAQQAELGNAISTVNELCGTQFGIMEDGCTVIDGETGSIENNTEKIWENVRAREAASKADLLGTTRAELDKVLAASVNDLAASRKAYDDASVAMDAYIDKYGSLNEVIRRSNESNGVGGLTGEAIKIQQDLGVWREATRQLQDAERAERQLAQTSTELAAEQVALMKVVENVDVTLSDLALSSEVAQQAFNLDGSHATQSIIDFGAAIQECSTDYEAMSALLRDPATMAEVIASYDGTAASLTGVFEEMGVAWDSAKAAAIDAQGTIAQMGDFLIGLSDDAYGAIRDMSSGVDDLAGKLAEAGISMSDLASIGEAEFGRLVTASGGSIDALISNIQNYNGIPIEPKDGRIFLDDTELTDSLGNVFVWNGTELVSKDGRATLEDQELRDAQNNVWVWNGTELISKSATAEATGNVPSGFAASQIRDTTAAENGLYDKTVDVNVSGNVASGVAEGVSAEPIPSSVAWRIRSNRSARLSGSPPVKQIVGLRGKRATSSRSASAVSVGSSSGAAFS